MRIRLGMLGKKGTWDRGTFGIDPKAGLIDIKMGTLSKTIPSIGGYIAAAQARQLPEAFHPAIIFSRRFRQPRPPQPKAALEVIEEESWRVQNSRKTPYFLRTLQRAVRHPP